MSSPRSSRGGGKYSSSVVMLTSSTPSRGANRSMTSFTNSSGAEAPAVTPMRPSRSSGSSSAALIRNTRRLPESMASFCSALVFEELADPITITASQRSAMAANALWRLVVAKHRSLLPGVQTSGKRSRTPSRTPAQSRWLSVVCARTATGVSKSGKAATPSEVLDEMDRARGPLP